MVGWVGGGAKYRNNEVEQIQQTHALSRSLRLPCLFSIFAIFLYLNEHHSSLSKDGASVIHHRQDTYRGGRGQDSSSVTVMLGRAI